MVEAAVPAFGGRFMLEPLRHPTGTRVPKRHRGPSRSTSRGS